MDIVAHYLHANGACTPAFYLMLMTEQVDSCLATSVVKAPFHKNPKHGTFPGIHFKNSQPNLY